MDVDRALAELRGRGPNFDPARHAEFTPAHGWHLDDLRRALPDGSWEIARRLMAGYEFADPSIVRAHYDPGEPLEGRTMLLELRFHGLRFHVGVRVSEVYEGDRDLDGRSAHVWGWAYQTLEGHIEQGQMNWELWRRPDSDAVLFRIHAFSRRSRDRSPIVQLGFALFGRREQLAFLHSTQERMAQLTAAALRDREGAELHRTAEALTARTARDTAPVHDVLRRRTQR